MHSLQLDQKVKKKSIVQIVPDNHAIYLFLYHFLDFFKCLLQSDFIFILNNVELWKLRDITSVPLWHSNILVDPYFEKSKNLDYFGI